MIVREREGSFVLIRQHDHSLASGELARHWAREPWPLESTLYAIAHHDVAWRGPDAEVRWNEEAEKPYYFADYPADEKVLAYAAGIDWLEERDRYAACLCSMHYVRLLRRFGGTEVERSFVDAEVRRQERLRAGMSGEELENLDRNLDLLRVCDGLSLYVCLNEPDDSGYPPPYPEGFQFEGEQYRPVWEDRVTLRLQPNPFSEAFELSIPYRTVGVDRQPGEEGLLKVRVTTS